MSYREDMKAIFPRLKALDGVRRGYDPLDTSDLEELTADLPEYNSGSQWYDDQLKSEKPQQRTDFIEREKEMDLKDLVKDCEKLLSSKKKLFDLTI